MAGGRADTAVVHKSDASAEAAASTVTSFGSSSSFYTPGKFPTSKPSAPPIYKLVGGGRRPSEFMEMDARLRAAQGSREMLAIVEEHLHRFDTGNVVVAFTTAAKLDAGQDMHTLVPVKTWDSLRERLLECADVLEPRGMSMCAYAAAKLSCGDLPLLTSLARVGARRAMDFGPTDVAKGCWAFAKLRFVEEKDAAGFWINVTREAERTIRGARFVDVSMMAWACAMTDQGHDGMFSVIASVTRQDCDTLHPRSLAGIAWSFGRAGQRDVRLFADIARRTRDSITDFVAHDVAAMCWGFAAAGVADAHVALFNELGAHVVSTGMLRRLSPPLAAELAWSFAAGGISNDVVFAELETLCVENAADLETEDVAGFAWSFATVGRREHRAVNCLAAYARRFAGRFRLSELRALTWAFPVLGAEDEAEILASRLRSIVGSESKDCRPDGSLQLSSTSSGGISGGAACGSYDHGATSFVDVGSGYERQ
eukprot:TRINITY_DN54600_c0_g1_i1.p1 TRINITY_DN54600_c0_g1~~TRINITY_DN54600_c0_g1_i1.p1  ORF type:complete len:536 (+),score=92.35 TRINITY_DN54600_c0_g1_i1:162-1610(+)